MRFVWALGLLLIPAIRRKKEEIRYAVEEQKAKLDGLLNEVRELRANARGSASSGNVVGVEGRKEGGCP